MCLGPINLLEACGLRAGCPRLVFPSSIATFGDVDLPAEVDDATCQHPPNSYGVAKVLGEQLLNDYSRKGFIDGRGVRLPAIVVRDEPNTAASGFASGLIREPLSGRDYVCPVSEQTRLPILSIQACVRLLVALAELPTDALGDYRSINALNLLPSAAEIAAAVRAHQAPGAIRFEPDPAVMALIEAWPQRLSRVCRGTSISSSWWPIITPVRCPVNSWHNSSRRSASAALQNPRNGVAIPSASASCIHRTILHLPHIVAGTEY